VESGSRTPGRTRRGEQDLEFARVLAFSDGVFAIAITLLVLQLEVPENASDLGSELADQLPDLFAFILSFAVLGRIWWAFHHRLFSGLEAFDGRLIALNFLYLALAVLVPFSSELLGDYGEETEGVVIYAANLGLLSLAGIAMSRYAFHHGLMRPDSEYRPDGGTVVIATVFLASIPVAFIDPTAGMLMWLLNFLGRTPARKVADRIAGG
jgi:uncharacterized membrane protein